MNDLLLYNPGELEVVINTKNGKAYTTQKGYQNLSEKSSRTVCRYCSYWGLRKCEPGSILEAVTGEPLWSRGLILMPSQIVLQGLILHNRPKALSMGRVGATIYLYRLAGFNVKVTLHQPSKQF